MKSIDKAREDIQTTIQNGLPQIRKELGVSQETFANLIGKSRQTISLIERKELDLSWEMCLAILAVIATRDPELLYRSYGKSFNEDFQVALQD